MCAAPTADEVLRYSLNVAKLLLAKPGQMSLADLMIEHDVVVSLHPQAQTRSMLVDALGCDGDAS